jgi:uncharacterized phage protein gp47/JayE
LNDLLTARTADQILADLIQRLEAKRASLQAQGVDVTDLTSGAVARTLLEIESASQADLWNLSILIAQMGFLDTASGEYLDILAANVYNLNRNPSVFAEHNVTLTCATGFGPYNLQAGDIIPATAESLQFQSITAGVLASGGVLTLRVRAERAGSAYNVAPGTITALKTPLPGVSVTNPIGSLLVAGADLENDDDLRERCRLRWPALGPGGPADAYASWAREASANIKQVRILDPSQTGRGPGSVDVLLWGEGSIGSADVNAANTLIQIRRPMQASVVVAAATQRLLPVTAIIRVKAAYATQVQANIPGNLLALQRRTAIGALVTRSSVIEALFDPIGTAFATLDVALSAPVGDVQLGAREAVVFVPTNVQVQAV